MPVRAAATRRAPCDPDDIFTLVSGRAAEEPCPLCGGLGHRITMCPKLQQQAQAGTKDVLKGNGGMGGDW